MSEYRNIPELAEKDITRFWTKVAKSEKCWLWTGSTALSGYGLFSFGGKRPGYYAHRIAWAICHGTREIPLHVLHRCDIRACVNPDHLFLGDDATNIADCVAKGRNNLGEKNGQAVLSKNDILEIRRCYAAGTPRITLGKEFGVCPQHIGQIVRRRVWTWL